MADRGLSDQVWAVGKDLEALQQAKAKGVIADYSTELEPFCSDADLILIAVPGLSVDSVVQGLVKLVKSDCVITDVSSVKQSTVNAAINAFGELPLNLVPGHPIAGSEKSGFKAAKPDLFERKKLF